MNAHFQYQESLKRIEKEVGLVFERIDGYCAEDKEHLTDYRNRFDADTYAIISDAYSLYRAEACGAMLKILDAIKAEKEAMEGQQSLEMVTA